MVIDAAQEDTLLALLNTTPVVRDTVVDRLAVGEAAAAWQRAHGGTGGEAERRELIRTRDALQGVLRGRQQPVSLAKLLTGVVARPRPGENGITWELDVAAERRSAVLAVLAWSSLLQTKPGRLRACANPECRLFLLDRSKTNRARWCSMAVCGNRMKARRHYERTRQNGAEVASGTE